MFDSDAIPLSNCHLPMIRIKLLSSSRQIGLETLCKAFATSSSNICPHTSASVLMLHFSLEILTRCASRVSSAT